MAHTQTLLLMDDSPVTVLAAARLSEEDEVMNGEAQGRQVARCPLAQPCQNAVPVGICLHGVADRNGQMEEQGNSGNSVSLIWCRL